MNEKKLKKLLLESLKDQYNWEQLSERERESIEDMVFAARFSIIKDYHIGDTFRDLLIVVYDYWQTMEIYLYGKKQITRLK